MEGGSTCFLEGVPGYQRRRREAKVFLCFIFESRMFEGGCVLVGWGGEGEFSVIDTYLTGLKALKQSPPLKRL